MTKLQFLLALHDKLSGLPRNDMEERLNFYSEMIEDRMEEGLSEAEAVAAVGSVDEIAAQIMDEIPLTKIVKEKMKCGRRLKAWEITLLAVGSPVWASLLIAGVAVVFSLYVTLWAAIISFWAAWLTTAVCAVVAVAVGFGFCITGHVSIGVAFIAVACVCAGLSIFLFLGCKVASTGILMLTKKMMLAMKRGFAKKEDVQ